MEPRAHKIRLKPNNVQRTYFAKACGTSRFSYNWALTEWNTQYESYKLDRTLPRPSEMDLRRKLNSIKKDSYPWMLEVTKCAPQQAIKDLGSAFNNFFKGTGKYPKKKKKFVNDSFYLSNDQFKVSGRSIRIPNLGWVTMCESLRFEGKVVSATISRQAGRWYVAINVEADIKVKIPNSKNQRVTNLDLGLRHLAIFPNGTKLPNPKVFDMLLKRKRRLNRSLSRKVRGSSNYKKARLRLASLDVKISDIRRDNLHKFTSWVIANYGFVAIEDLDIKAMMKNKFLARLIADASWYEIRRQLEYKASTHGVVIQPIARYYPSSKTCNSCKAINRSLRDQEYWTCSCGVKHDRDVNAAINILREGLSTASSAGIYACGDISKAVNTAVADTFEAGRELQLQMRRFA